MNITANDRLLELLLKALQSTLIPELQSSNAKAVAGIMQAVLADLLKRETGTPQLVSQFVDEGATLTTEMRQLLTGAGLPVPATTMLATGPATTLAASLQQHSVITQNLAVLSEQLASVRGEPVLANQQATISRQLLKAAHWELGYYHQQQKPLPPRASNTVAPDGPLTAETLTAFLRSRHPDGTAVRVSGFEAIPGGFGKQTSLFTLHDGAGGTQQLIARKSDPHPMLSNAAFIIEKEFHLVQAVSASGYLAPRPLWLGTGIPGVDASFYVMERMPGKIPGSFLGGLQGGDAQAMLLDVATQLGRLHALRLDAFAGYIRDHDDVSLLGGTVESCYRNQIAQWRHYAADVEQLSSPFLHYLIDWLERNVPADRRAPVLLHGDFNIHNLLVENDRVSGVLDWECAMFGAPEQDLAYIQPHIGQHVAWDRFVARYIESGGRELDTASMPYYLAFSALRLHIAMLRATRNLQSGANDDIRYAMVELGFGVRFMELAMAGTGGLTST